jgi:adenosylcobyric acid synthase
MGRAQVMQAEAAGIDPMVEMNPVLLKPTSDQGSQVVVMGRPIGNMAAMNYLNWKEELLPVIDQAYSKLAAAHDIIIIEGAGSPAEINLNREIW